MDIRKFFGSTSTKEKGVNHSKSEEKPAPSKTEHKTSKVTPSLGNAPKTKTPTISTTNAKTSTKTSASLPVNAKTGTKTSTRKRISASIPVNAKTGTKTSSPRKKISSSPVKKLCLEEEEEAVIIEDNSDEEVIKTSQPTSKLGKINKINDSVSKNVKKNGSTPNGKPSSSVTLKEAQKHKKFSDLTSGSTEDKGDGNDFIEIESVKSSASRDRKMTSVQGKKENKSTKGSPGDRNKEKGKKNEKQTSNVVVPSRRESPRKKSSPLQDVKVTEKRNTKKQKSHQLSSEDEDEVVNVVSDSEDTEEVIVSRRQRRSKGSMKQSKRTARVLESDSEEDPLGSDKPKLKRKKKQPIIFVDSDEEKKVTALDKFVIHNVAKPESDQARKKEEDKKVKGTPVSVADFFGTGATSRSDRRTTVAKRKHEETEKKEVVVDLTFDEEIHDDDDFLKTLEQLDGPNVKKVNYSEQEEKDIPEMKKENGGSLASKLAGKIKQKSPVSAVEAERDSKKSPLKAAKVSTPKKSSRKTGHVYSMEVTKTEKPGKTAASPEKCILDKKTKETPVKPEPRQTPVKQRTTPDASKGRSSEKKPAAGTSEDDGFGSSKAIAGFRAFKAREGPLALGSKEIPEGAENCMEGLTFVITGVLDSIERDHAKTLIEKHGGKVTGSISRKTSYLVVGREAGESKLAKAQQLKVKQIDEDGLFNLIETLPGKISKYETQAKEQIKKETLLKAEKEKTRAAKMLEPFRSENDVRNTKATTPSPKKKKFLFTQITDSSESGYCSTAPVSSPVSSKLLGQSQLPSHEQRLPSSKADQSEVLLWVDKHKPTSLKQIIGQQGEKSNANKLLHWLKSWHENVFVKQIKPAGNFFGKGDGAGCRAALLSGPPGIGKTTTATLVCQAAGFSYVELNASDTRSKRSLKEVVSESLNNQTIVDYTGHQHTGGPPSGQTHHCLIMDEVDGMAGNEDRGGLQELVQLIKGTKIPILCICNDRNSMKMRTLSNYCFDLRFQRPRLEQIKGQMMSLAFKEGLKIPPAAMNAIIQAANSDIRQVIHNLSMWSATDKTLTFEQVKSDAKKSQKDLKLGPFDVCRKVFVNNDETRKMSINDKSDLFFHDYSFGPLFVHENYPHVIPLKARDSRSRHMSCLARTIDSICDGDLLDRLIRSGGNWNLLPAQAMYSSVIPGEIMRGTFPQMPDFPQFLGKFSTTNKTHRILQELGTHMRLQISSDKRSLNLDYLPALRACLTSPLTLKGAEGVPEVIQIIDDYDIIKEDFDNIMDITKWPNCVDPLAKLDSKTKAAFTRQYNKEIHLTPYATGVLSKKRRGRGAPIEEGDFALQEGEGEEDAMKVESEEENESLEADTMIKSKKLSAGKKGQKASQQQTASQKAKGGGKQTRKGN